MRIFIDARLFGAEHTGIGRYTENVLKFLPKYLQGQALKASLPASLVTVLVHPSYKDAKFGKGWQVIASSIRPYSFLEQIVIPHLVRVTKSDLYLGFHFNVPVFLTVPFVTVIHDLIKSYFVGADNTTRNRWFYQIKRLGYEWSMSHAVTKARALIVPSNTVKNQILAKYNLEPSRINVIPEAPDLAFRQKLDLGHWLLDIPKKSYLLFVGNAYPHKNLKVLLEAFNLLNDKDLHLVIVAKQNSFLSKELSRSRNGIIVLSGLTDQELVLVYKQAKMLITPSLMEGYGLVGLEALILGTPVVASNIPVYREVYRNKVTYFDPESPKDLVRAIKLVGLPAQAGVKPRLSSFSFDRNWQNVAKDISEVIYESRARLRSH